MACRADDVLINTLSAPIRYYSAINQFDLLGGFIFHFVH
ncbi:hypothetical protein CSC04_2895 [Enterobacter roggenkampii]|nr:hypothetical protein CSC04_2895 [Enterobacter roggenkampii]